MNDVLRQIWLNNERGGSPHPFIATRVDGKWTEFSVTTNGATFQHEKVIGDVYFTPNLFIDDTRSNVSCETPSALFADLDRVSPLDCPLKPSIAWETSPGSYQAVWLVDKPWRSFMEWSHYNKEWTRLTGADKGGWFGSKLLRVPGTFNHKDKFKDSGYPKGRLLWTSDHRFFRATFQKMLPKFFATPEGTNSSYPSTPAVIDPYQLSPRTLHLLRKPHINDRSKHIWTTVGAIRDDGFTEHEAFSLILPKTWNKYVGRNDALRATISKVYTKG